MRSTNSTLMRRRSSLCGADAAGVATRASARSGGVVDWSARGVPQPVQNAMSAASGRPQWTQFAVSSAPHPPQNLSPSPAGRPHRAQRLEMPTSRRT
jgi:hypothetical protein